MIRAAALGLMLLSCAGPLAAQAYQCRVPATAPLQEIRPDGPIRTAPVTGYVMALSWSPEFCKPRLEQRSHARQCSRRAGRFGFVLHGLWPQSARGWRQWCPTSARPTGAQLAGQLCRSPSARLVARQWAKHGACMARTPRTYFRVSNILFDSLRWPDLDRLSRKEALTAGDLREVFVAANRGWRKEAVGIVSNERGWLEEVRLCYDRRFRPTACDAQRFGPSDDAALNIWRGL